MRKPIFILIAIHALYLLAGCSSQRKIVTITSCKYDERTGKTTYMVLPYGSANIPGKWMERRYNAASRQQFFRNSDSTELSVAMGPANKMEFYQPGLTNYAFAEGYYEWESAYQRTNLRQKTELIMADSANNYLLWLVYSDSVNTYQLFAATKCNCKEGSFLSLIVNGGKISAIEARQLLQSIYPGNK